MEWENVPLAKVAEIAAGLEAEKKYCIVKFSNANAATFINYQNGITMKEFHKDILKIQMGAQTEDEAQETLRAQLVMSMRHGKFLLIDVGAVTPNLLFKDSPIWPAQQIWNWTSWDDDKNNSAILKDGEDVDMNGNEGWSKMTNFCMGILVKDDAQAEKVCALLPNHADFKKLNIA